MSTLSSLSKGTLVHVVFEQDGGRRHWFHTTERKKNDKTGEWLVLPIVGTEMKESRPMSLDFALISQRRWKEIGFRCRLALEANGPFIDEPDAVPSQFKHVDYFITTDEVAQTGYEVRAVHTPQGKQFCLRFENPNLAQQSIFMPLDAGPEACITRAREMGFLEIETPKPSPFRDQNLAESQRLAQQEVNASVGRIRPGDIRR